MSADLLDTLSTVASGVLRTTAFALAEPCATHDLVACDGAAIQARIQFDGSMHGEMRLVASQELCATLAADILTDDASNLLPEQVADTFKELLNMICGQWLTAIHGDIPVFALGVPDSWEIGGVEWETLRNSTGAAGLLIDESPLMVVAHTQEVKP